MAVPVRNDDEILSNSAFDALLGAMSRPGEIKQLPSAGFTSVIAALIDRECTAHTTEAALEQQIQKAGARLVDARHADFVFCSVSEVVELIPQLKMGSDLYPDDGATLVVLADKKEETMLTLQGPGIEAVAHVNAFNIPKEAWTRRTENIRYPMGFDMIIVSDSHVLAIPRSTQVEID